MKYLVKDLMVPISEYATVSEGATLYEAVAALEKAQEEFAHTRYSHRAVLILDKSGRIMGKLNQFDFLQALEPEDNRADQVNDLRKFGFSETAIVHQQEQSPLKGISMDTVFQKASEFRVEDYMRTPSDGEYVDENTSMNTAVHQLIAGHYLSLLVTRGKDIVGVLRLSDTFAAVFHAMKEKETKE